MVSVTTEASTAPGRYRRCTACKLTRLLDQFDQIAQPSGTIDRRRLCRHCIAAVDAAVRDPLTTNAQIIRRFHVSGDIVRERRDLLGAPGRTYRRLTDVDRLTELTLAGQLDTAAIAAELGVEVHTVRRTQITLGLRETQTQFGPVSDETLEKARRLIVDEKVSYLEAGRTLDVDVSTLRRHFPGHGWQNADRSLMAQVLHSKPLRELHQELRKTAS